MKKDYSALMASGADTMTTVYEIWLVGIASSKAVLLVITAATVEDATDFARRALKPILNARSPKHGTDLDL